MNRVGFAQMAIMTKNQEYKSWLNWFGIHWRQYIADVARRNISQKEFFDMISHIVSASSARSYGLQRVILRTIHNRETCEIVILNQSAEMIVKIYYTLKLD